MEGELPANSLCPLLDVLYSASNEVGLFAALLRLTGFAGPGLVCKNQQLH
jgi:hypothetical protein